MNRTTSILRKAIGQGISIALGYGAYYVTKDVVIALIVTVVASRITSAAGL